MARTVQVCSAGAASVSLSIETTTNTLNDVTIVSGRRDVGVWFYDSAGAQVHFIRQTPLLNQTYDLTALAIPATSRTIGSKTFLRCQFRVHF